MDDVSIIDIPANAVTRLYLWWLAGSGLIYLILHHFWGRYVLISFSQIEGHGLVAAGLSRVWFLFAWAIVVTTIISFINPSSSSLPYGIRIIKGWWLSLNAGVFEELIYRWLTFFTAMIVLPFLNFITFGLMKWFYMHLLVPLANWATFHALAPQLHSSASWTVGAAIVFASISFRDVHHGFITKINAWFIGMLLFWLMFHYGLLTAIAAHVLYDGFVFTAEATLSDRPRRTIARRR